MVFMRLLSRCSTKSIEEADSPVVESCATPLLWRLTDRLNIDRDLAACTLCELFCTFFLLYGGGSIGAAKVAAHATFDYSTPIGWGLWLVFTLYLGFNISGAHLNPAISFLHFTLGGITLKRFLFYSLAQFIGAFLGAALTYLVYYEGISAYDGGVRKVYGPTATADIFATYPKPYLSIAGGIIDQVLTTAMLAVTMLCVTDPRNRIPKQAQPLLLGLSLWTIVAFWSQNCGAALNPARDFGPRLFTYFAGYGLEVFSYRNYRWFVVPLTAPMVGGVLGGIIYRRFIGDYMPSVGAGDGICPSATLPFHVHDSGSVDSASFSIAKRPLDILSIDGTLAQDRRMSIIVQ